MIATGKIGLLKDKSGQSHSLSNIKKKRYLVYISYLTDHETTYCKPFKIHELLCKKISKCITLKTPVWTVSRTVTEESCVANSP